MKNSSYSASLAIALVSCLAIACGDNEPPPQDERSDASVTDDGGNTGDDRGDASVTDDGGSTGDDGGSTGDDGGSTEPTKSCLDNTEGCECVPGSTAIEQGSCNEGLVCVSWNALTETPRTQIKEGTFATCVKPCASDDQCHNERGNRHCASINLGAPLGTHASEAMQNISKICTDRLVKTGQICGMSRNIDSWVNDTRNEPAKSMTVRTMIGCEGTATCLPFYPDLNPDEGLCFDFCGNNADCKGLEDTPVCGRTYITGSQFDKDKLEKPRICQVKTASVGMSCSDYLITDKQYRLDLANCTEDGMECFTLPPYAAFEVGGAVCQPYQAVRADLPGRLDIQCPAGMTPDSLNSHEKEVLMCGDGCDPAPDTCGADSVCVWWSMYNTPPDRDATTGALVEAHLIEHSKCMKRYPPKFKALIPQALTNEKDKGFWAPVEIQDEMRKNHCWDTDLGFLSCPAGTACVLMGLPDDENSREYWAGCVTPCDTGFRDASTEEKEIAVQTVKDHTTYCNEKLGGENYTCVSQRIPMRPELGFCATSSITKS